MTKLFLTFLMVSNIAIGQGICKVQFTACEDCTPVKNGLAACKKYSDSLVNENAVLKQLNEKIKQQRDAAIDKWARAEESPLIPFWGWIIIGAGAGVATYAIIRK